MSKGEERRAKYISLEVNRYILWYDTLFFHLPLLPPPSITSPHHLTIVTIYLFCMFIYHSLSDYSRLIDCSQHACMYYRPPSLSPSPSFYSHLPDCSPILLPPCISHTTYLTLNSSHFSPLRSLYQHHHHHHHTSLYIY